MKVHISTVMYYFTLKFCYLEAEVRIQTKILSPFKINMKLSLTVGDGLNTFKFLFITQNNFQSKLIYTYSTVKVSPFASGSRAAIGDR